MKILLGLDIWSSSLKALLDGELRKSVVEANVFAMKSSCSRNMDVLL